MVIIMFDTKKFGAYLSRLRKNADMTQSDLAIKLNLTRQAISKYELGDSFPDISTITEIAKIFNISFNDLINSGNPTKGEADIFTSAISDTDTPGEYGIKDLINLAPLLKPSILDRLSQNLSDLGLDISGLVSLVQYLSDDRIFDLIQRAEINTLNYELLEKLMPFLDENARLTIFEKILDGELDWHLIVVMSPYIEYLNTTIEAAVMEGCFPRDVFKLISEYKAMLNSKKKNKEL